MTTHLDQVKPHNYNAENEDRVEMIAKGPFNVSQKKLVDIVSKYQQDRTFSEDVDELETIGAEEFLEKALVTSYKKGISDEPDDISRRIEAFGHNKKPDVQLKGFWALMWDALGDFTLRILVVAAVVSIAISVGTAKAEDRSHAWVEGFAILVAVFVCSSVAAGNDYQKERQFKALNSVADSKKNVTVYRSGTMKEIHQSELLTGDVVLLREGMEIPADGLILKDSDVCTDESAMTGETDPLKKTVLANCVTKRNQMIAEGRQNTAKIHDVPSPILMSGTKCMTGEGLFLVLVVGDLSCEGKIGTLLRAQEPEATPLQMKLEAIANDIGKFGLISAIIIVFVLMIRFGIERAILKNWDNEIHPNEILNNFIIGVTIVVVAIPEGLPLSVTISLAFSVKRMLKDKNLVRKLQACETMGGANMICSDKTGTLTQNKMTFTQFWNEKTYDIDTYSEKISLSTFFPGNEEIYINSLAINTSASLRPVVKGSKTEVCLLEFIERCGFNYEDLKGTVNETRRYPFNSKRKRMSVIIQCKDGVNRLFIKGASEMVMEACTQFQRLSGEIIPFTDQIKSEVEVAIGELAGNALRTLIVGYKEINDNDDIDTTDDKGVYDIEKNNLTFLMVLGIKDILRQEVPEAVQNCIKAGIKVRMVTGDNKLTARAIAKDCGIIRAGDTESIVLDGTEFIQRIGGVVCKKCKTKDCDCPRDKQTAKTLKKEIRIDTIANGEEFDKIYPHLDVLSRSRPEDKYALVTGLIEREHVVAVTGDGTNDAPALKKADVGFAMGIAGTEVAKEASDIILLDDNFKSIVKAVLWGRNIYDSIRKFLQFQLTVNVVAVFLTFFGFASLALATESPTDELLTRKPHNRNEYIVSKKMFKHILGQSFLQMLILLILTFAGEHFIPELTTDKIDELITGDMIMLAGNPAVRTRVIILNGWGIKYNGKAWSIKKPDDFKTITSGRMNTISVTTRLYPLANNKDWDGSDYLHKEEYWGPSRHMTFIFNCFVFLQIFNFLNARKLRDEINIFEGISKNMLFLGIVGFIIVLQVFLVTFGNKAFHCYKYYGLDWDQWLLSIAISSITFFLFLSIIVFYGQLF